MGQFYLLFLKVFRLMVWMFIYKKLRFLYLCNRRSNPSRIGLFYQFYLSISSSYHAHRDY
ncbi:hypothetical protein HanXRQr2_Chr02g0068171 [Helianthus annuus]|uniref:Uncharacterized protein n=1 Tax=Helianthus annuus TaxID=4232 RepID=A0A9K3JNU8_HELAN|nr:hypothetical protein HanXRQr2_Chr02g0068171 [Helianthus annuus]